MLGFLLGVWTKFNWLGFTFVQAVIFSVAWNYFVPEWNQLELFTLPVMKVSIWFAWSLLVIFNFITTNIKAIVKALTPNYGTTENG